MMWMMMGMAAWAQDAPSAEMRTTSTPMPRWSVGLHLARQQVNDEAFETFSTGDALPSWGAKVGMRLAERVELIGSWQTASRGSEIRTIVGDTEQRFIAAIRTHDVGVGLRADVAIADLLLPYVSVQGTMTVARAQFDDDLTDDDNLNQLSASGASPGVLAFAGGELRIPATEQVHPTLHLEVGYGYISSLSLGDFGALQPQGVAVRGGFGVRF